MERNSRRVDEEGGTSEPKDKGDCYVCTETATSLCKRCGGCVCDEHDVDGSEVCVNCG
jgi:hypothetical protein